MLDYETLKVIWWLLVGVLLLGFAVMDGHDMGVGMLLPFAGRNDVERRVIINTVGPHWDGNQVWFITAGGALFAAWPTVYATAFSGFYVAMLAVLWAMFFRPVGFDYRSKIADPRWRRSWDWGLFVGGAVPPLIFGVAIGNLLQGVPFHFDADLRSTYTGSFFALLNPFALVCGVASLAMLGFHGANYLAIRTEGEIERRARVASLVLGILLITTFATAGAWLAGGIDGYRITSVVDPGALPDPLAKTVVRAPGAWFDNYTHYPATIVLPILGFAATLLGIVLAQMGKATAAFWSSALAELGIIGTVGATMFPFVMPSSSDPTASLTVWDSVSSQRTLWVMFLAVVIFTPLVVAYTGWCYRVLSGKVTERFVDSNDHSLY
jgi:cytochrome bd ubiquinol oxidase subunit II